MLRLRDSCDYIPEPEPVIPEVSIDDIPYYPDINSALAIIPQSDVRFSITQDDVPVIETNSSGLFLNGYSFNKLIEFLIEKYPEIGEFNAQTTR